jgi:cytochrome b
MKLPMSSQQNLIRVRVWDLPTRLFHWSLAFCFIGLVITGTVGHAALIFHFRFGYTMLALLLFRLVWGVLGGRWSRFSSFLFTPKATLAYLKGKSPSDADVGHTPLGALSVWTLLFFLIAQVASGLVSDDEISFSGPLSHFVSNATVSLATIYHTNIGKWILLALVLVHLVAIVVYTRRQRLLVSAMFHGDKHLPVPAPASRDDMRSRSLALFIFSLCAATAYWVSTLMPVF